MLWYCNWHTPLLSESIVTTPTLTCVIPPDYIITPGLFKENDFSFSFNGVSTRVEILAPPCHWHNLPSPIEVGDIGQLVIYGVIYDVNQSIYAFLNAG